MWGILKRKIEDIRGSDDAAKKRWIVIATSGAMVIILGIWFVSLGASMPRATEDRDMESDGFLGIMKNGAAAVSGNLKEEITAAVKSMMGKIFREREVTIQ